MPSRSDLVQAVMVLSFFPFFRFHVHLCGLEVERFLNAFTLAITSTFGHAGYAGVRQMKSVAVTRAKQSLHVVQLCLMMSEEEFVHVRNKHVFWKTSSAQIPV